MRHIAQHDDDPVGTGRERIQSGVNGGTEAVAPVHILDNGYAQVAHLVFDQLPVCADDDANVCCVGCKRLLGKMPDERGAREGEQLLRPTQT